jgi:hypothetical protein
MSRFHTENDIQIPDAVHPTAQTCPKHGCDSALLKPKPLNRARAAYRMCEQCPVHVLVVPPEDAMRPVLRRLDAIATRFLLNREVPREPGPPGPVARYSTTLGAAWRLKHRYLDEEGKSRLAQRWFGGTPTILEPADHICSSRFARRVVRTTLEAAGYTLVDEREVDQPAVPTEEAQATLDAGGRA